MITILCYPQTEPQEEVPNPTFNAGHLYLPLKAIATAAIAIIAIREHLAPRCGKKKHKSSNEEQIVARRVPLNELTWSLETNPFAREFCHF